MWIVNCDALAGIERKKVLALGDHRWIGPLWNIEKFVRCFSPKPPGVFENTHDEPILTLRKGRINHRLPVSSKCRGLNWVDRSSCWPHWPGDFTWLLLQYVDRPRHLETVCIPRGQGLRGQRASRLTNSGMTCAAEISDNSRINGPRRLFHVDMFPIRLTNA